MKRDNRIKWVDFIHILPNEILSETSMIKAFSSFWRKLSEIVKDANQKILIQFKVELENGSVRTISRMQIITINDSDILYEVFKEYWNLKSQEYHLNVITKIIYTYKIIKENMDLPRKINRAPSVKTKPLLTFKGYDLPSTMDFTKWGKYNFNEDKNLAIIEKPNSMAIYSVELFDTYQKVELKIKDKILLSFKDIVRDHNDLSTFTRVLHEHTYDYDQGYLILIQKEIKKVKYLTKVYSATSLSDKFMTMDLETRTIEGIISPYAVSIYDGRENFSFYLSDFKSPEELVENSIIHLLRRKYNNYKVYIHNFSNFDSIFMMKVLSNMNLEIYPIIREGRIIDLKIKRGLYTIHFRDSYLLLPSSLARLANNFGVEDKGIFPYEFVNNSNIPLNYIGKVPNREFYPNLSIEEYNSILKSYPIWDLRKETIKYCEQDVTTLYLILKKFNEQIFRLFRLNILKYPTLSSLAFAIYRSKFMGDAKIPLIHGAMYNFMKRGYTGGAVDVYKPKGRTIYRYDVNSLYPYIMKSFPMPVGSIKYFEGDISLINPNAFGIFEVEVETPRNLLVPILQTRIVTNNGVKTIAPIGNWSDVYFSHEIYNAKKHGYKFKIIKGYIFDKDFIFSEYVDFLYNLKVHSDKGSPNYIISKLLLNSLYGRLGMSPDKEKHVFVSTNDSLKIYSKYTVSNVIDFKNGRELISFFDSDQFDTNTNISIPISLCVTAMARVYMSQFKSMKDIELYYTDTDSIDIDKPLDSKYVGKELGQLKLDHIFKEAVFLAPKVYGGITSEYEYVKVKGLKNPIPYDKLEPLLQKGSHLEVSQNKWYRNVSSGNILVQNEIYSLMATDNKRQLIFSENTFVDTKPLLLEKGVIQ
jgi:hypothetical protein